jgi:uncharacterized protein (DUF362 family)
MSRPVSVNGTPVVAVMKATYGSAEAQITEALRLLDYVPSRRQLLLKPNLFTSARWLPLGGIPRSAMTDVRFIEALLQVFQGYEIVIAEGGMATSDTDATLRKTGVIALARKYGAQVVNLDHSERVEVPWAYGKLKLPALLRTHEYINVPKLKTHILTGVSLGCKNQKGLLTPADKVRFHQKFNLNEAIRALADAVRPALTIVDGIVGMEGPGPTIGRPLQSRLIVAGRDLRAVDVACCDLMSMPLEQVPHLDRLRYRTAGRTIEEMRMRFELPSELVVANAHFHGTLGTCSRCLMSAHDGMAALWRSPYPLLRASWSVILHRTDVMVGPNNHALPDVHGRLVCYGDCTRELAEEHGLLWIPGCPPRVKEHLKLY